MLRNSIQNLVRDQATLSGSRFHHVINFSVCVYHSDLWFYNPDSDKCQILCFVCRCVDHLYNSINGLFLQLHKVTCLLLGQKPARRNHLEPLPDVLKDVARFKMVNALPDVIPMHQETSSNREKSAESSILMTSAYSSHQRNIRRHKNQYSLSDVCYCSQESPEEDRTGITFSHHINSRSCAENSDLMYHKVIVHSRNRDESGGTHSQTSILCQIPSINQFYFSGQFSHQKGNGNNKHSQRVLIPTSMTGQNQSSSYKNVTDGDQAEPINNHTINFGQELPKSDSEITRDIVMALRRVGDNLDSRLRFENKKSLLAIMGASKISDGWSTLMTLGHQSVLGAMVCLSMELLRQLNCL